MSLVGPRPERPEFVDLFGDRIARYEDRLRQVGRNRLGAECMACEARRRYATGSSGTISTSRWSLTLDIKILLMTLGAIFTGSRDA